MEDILVVDVARLLVPLHGLCTAAQPRLDMIIVITHFVMICMGMGHGEMAYRSDDLDKRQGDMGVPLLRRLEDEIVESLADLAAGCKHT